MQAGEQPRPGSAGGNLAEVAALLCEVVQEAAGQRPPPRLVRSLRPGGWLVLGRMAFPPGPLAEATTALRIIRAGVPISMPSAASDLAATRRYRYLSTIRRSTRVAVM